MHPSQAEAPGAEGVAQSWSDPWAARETNIQRAVGRVSVDCSSERPACLQGEEGSACGSFRWAG